MAEACWRAAFQADGDPFPALAARTAEVERTVLELWQHHLPDWAARGLAIVALGGLARRETYPFSDIDLLVVANARVQAKLREALGKFLAALWDAGLRVSLSVRSPQECSELHHGNLEFAVSLLDQRLLVGDTKLYGEFLERVAELVRRRRQPLMDGLCSLAKARHARFEQTIHHLEPNVKEAPGGLRDLHLLRWLDRLRGDEAIRSVWLEPLRAAHAFLSTLRCFLHLRARRDDNLLSFEAQEELAAQAFSRGEPPEAWMGRYYRHAREVYRAAVRAMDLCHGRWSGTLVAFHRWRSRLSNAEFTVARNCVWLRSPQRLAQDPATVLGLFSFIGRHDLDLALETEHRISEAMPAIERHFAQPGAHWPLLSEVLATPYAARALMRMNEIGLLGALLPEWRGIESLPVRDFYHRYTVDEHTLRAVLAFDELQHNAPSGPRRRFASLASEISRPEVLRLALLLHDLGKGQPGGSHVQASLALAERIMERIQLPWPERRLVRFLIHRHLDLSVALATRDLADPETLRALAASVGQAEHLPYLTLLTYADISAVRPGAMSDWRAELLWQFHVRLARELLRQVATDRVGAGSQSDPELAGFLEGLPRRYWLCVSPEEMAWHLELARICRDRPAAAAVRRRQDVYEAAVVAHDRRFLFASLAGALTACGMNILRGMACTNRRGLAVDTFVFEDLARTLDLNPRERDRLVTVLERAAAGHLNVPDMLRRRAPIRPPSRHRRIQPRVTLELAASSTATVIEVVAQDRPGLLFDLARTISEAGCNIETVLVETRAHQAFDVFYVSLDGARLPAALAESLRAKLLEAAAGA
ncbi:MAG: ACT domain-containing protein [Bryobacterales bacterium]|nr:ACT domain-containing protein [Bryobacteraceae bacterium]MDW8128909.1 ACT domain-containing protein [Bryobacterales bacterium]